MWALVESGSVTKVYNRPRALTIGDVSYPQNIFTMWTSSELEALGIYEVVIDNTNFKNQEYYINTDQTFAFASGTVTASYGSATAQAIADTLYTAEDETDGLGTEGEVKSKGLKTHIKKLSINKLVVYYHKQIGIQLELQTVEQRFQVVYLIIEQQ